MMQPAGSGESDRQPGSGGPACSGIEDSAAVLFCLHPTSHELSHISANVREALGYHPDELAGTADVWTRLRPRGCRNAQQVLAEAVAARERNFSVPLRLATRCGELRNVLISGRLHYDAAGHPELAVCVLVDLTAEMRASAAALETARREQKMAVRMPVGAANAAGASARPDERAQRAGAERERVLSIIDASADFVAAFGADQRTLYVNPGGRALLGIPAAERLDTLHISAFTTPASYEMLRSHAIPAALRRGSWSGDATLLTRDRVEVPVHQSVTAHFEADGSLAYISTIARDMTTHRRLEEQLRQAQKMEAVGRLAGGIAHDFNNLLTAVTGHSALLLDALDPANPLHRDAEEIRRAGERAASLTRQLLAFSRQQVLRPVPMELHAVIEEMSGMLQRLVGGNVVLRTSSEPPIGRVRADPAQVQQVVLNLVLNARDAMPGGGVVDLSTACVELPHPDLPFPPAASPGRWNVLTVRDSGTGMDAETMKRVFEPFFSTRESGRGAGLGLSTVYGIVEQSGGFLDVQSRVGVGSVFRIFLPVCTEEAAVATAGIETTPPPPAPPPADTTILLAEDDAAVRALARRVLVREGYNVIEAKDGRDALRLAAAYGGRIDLLLTDVVMPEAGGPELARRLTAERPDVKVVYTSGYTQDEAVRHGILQAAVPFLPKPFAPAALVALIRRTLAGHPPAPDDVP
jgi:two-component system, cell cycle sensor histidine kinase and response regulator CckA